MLALDRMSIIRVIFIMFFFTFSNNKLPSKKSNKVKIANLVEKHPGLRFYQIKGQFNLANGTVEHHIKYLTKTKKIIEKYDNKVPRYYSYNIEDKSQIILLRLRQHTTSKIIKALLQSECLNFSQIVKSVKRSPGTVSLYKNILLKDGIILGSTKGCDTCSDTTSKIKYELVDPDRVRTLIMEYGKSSLKKCVDNLSDVFLSLK